MALETDGGAAAGGEGGAAAPSAGEIFTGVAPAPTGGEGGQQPGGEGGQQQAGGEGGGADPAWWGEISTDVPEGEKSSLQDFLKANGVKDVNTLTQRFRDTQRALHEKGGIKVPGEGAPEAEIKAFHKAIGVPDDVSGYAITPPKGADGEPVQLQTALLDRLAGIAHKAGIPETAYKALVTDFVQAQLEEMSTSGAAVQAEADAKMKEWGDSATRNIAAINNAAAALGMNGDEVRQVRDALGAGRAMDIFAKLGHGIAEDVILNGQGGGQRFGVSAAEAQTQLDAMRADKAVMDKIMVPGSAERIRYDRLNAIIGAEADRKRAAGE